MSMILESKYHAHFVIVNLEQCVGILTTKILKNNQTTQVNTQHSSQKTCCTSTEIKTKLVAIETAIEDIKQDLQKIDQQYCKVFSFLKRRTRKNPVFRNIDQTAQ